MASPALQGDIDSPHPYHVIACGCASIGATGAVAATPANTGNGIFKSITRTGVGTYDVALAETWKATNATLGPLFLKADAIAATFATTDGSIVKVSAEQVSNVTTPKFTIKCYKGDGTMALADLPNPSVLEWSMDHQFVVP